MRRCGMRGATRRGRLAAALMASGPSTTITTASSSKSRLMMSHMRIGTAMVTRGAMTEMNRGSASSRSGRSDNGKEEVLSVQGSSPMAVLWRVQLTA